MKSREEIYQFVKRWYKHSRFEGMAGDWCPNYPDLIVDGYIEWFETHDHAFISCHESNTGQSIKFNEDLEILNKDEEIIEYDRKKGHLTHLF